MNSSRFHRLSAVLGVLLLALSACNPHEFPEAGGGVAGRDYPVRLVFNDGMPELRTIEATKAGDAAAAPLRARYNVQVFRYTGQVQYGLDPDYSFSFTRSGWEDLDTTIYLPVDPYRYKVAVWTDRIGSDGEPVYEAGDFEHICYAPDFGPGPRDAFFGTADVDLNSQASDTPARLELDRSVARIRFILPEALTFLSGRGIDASSITSTLRYTSALPDGFNLFLRSPRAERAAGGSFTATAELDYDGDLVFCTDHLLAGGTERSVGVEFTARDASGATLYSYTGEVPILRGHVTTVSFKRSGGSDDRPGGIGIDPGFDGEIEIPIGF